MKKNCASSPPTAAPASSTLTTNAPKELFAELEKFGVRHDDADLRNITYRFADGRFCLIDFEFATILPESETTPT